MSIHNIGYGIQPRGKEGASEGGEQGREALSLKAHTQAADGKSQKGRSRKMGEAQKGGSMNNKEKPKRPRGTGSIFQMPGSSKYWIKYSRNGQPVRESSGSDKIKTAENLLKQRTGELANHTWVAPKDRRVTVDDLYSALLDDYRNNEMASLEGAEQRWQRQPKEGKEMPEPGRLKKFFTGIRALAVSTDMLNKYVGECREDELANATINRDLAALRRAFNLAVRAGKIQKAQVPIFPHMKEAAPRAGFVEESDYAKLAQHATELWLRAMLATAYTFGFRKSELLNLRVSQVDLTARTIRLNAGETESGEGRVVKMTQDVYTLLAACVAGKGRDGFVFTRADGSQILDFRERWDKLTAAAGRSGLLFHDLRRSGVRNMIRRGIPEVVAMRISGHKTRAVFDRYNIVSEADLAEAARKIEAGKKLWAENGQTFDHQGQQENTTQGANRYN